MAACLRTPTMPSMSDLHSRNQTTLLEGQLASVGLADLIQLVCLGAQSVRIHLLHPARGAFGSVTVLDGAVVDAEVDGHRGEPALFRLMGVDDGGFRVNALEERARVSTSIARHWQELLLEAARVSDEAKAREPEDDNLIVLPIRRTEPPSPSVFSPPTAPEALAAPLAPSLPEPAVEETSRPISSSAPAATSLTGAAGARVELSDFERSLREATAAYLRRDLAQALELFEACNALRPNDSRVKHNLELLRKRKNRT